MSETIYLLTMLLPLGTILLVFGMKYFSAFQQARARQGEDHGYRELIEKSVAAQSETAAALDSMRADLAELKARVASVEHILKAVE